MPGVIQGQVSVLPAVLEMTNSAEPESAKAGDGWEDRQPLVPNGAGGSPGEAPGSLGRVTSMPDQAGRLGRASTSGTPRAPSRFVFGRSRSMQDEAEQPGSSRAGQQGGFLGRWRRSGQYSIAEDQVMIHNGPPGSAHAVARSQLQHEPPPLWSAASELPAHGLSAHLKRTRLVAYRKEAVHEYVCLDRVSHANGQRHGNQRCFWASAADGIAGI